jgi:hypothetical protein
MGKAKKSKRGRKNYLTNAEFFIAFENNGDQNTRQVRFSNSQFELEQGT